MEVKVYREKENEPMVYDEKIQERYNELVSVLGIKPPVEKKCPNVYIYLKPTMVKQLSAICPLHVNTTNYVKTTIPPDVLEVLYFATQNQMFQGYEIWSDDEKPDPLLVGWTLSEEDVVREYTWNKTYYLLARWGDEALELPELLQLGFNRIKQKMIDSSLEIVHTCKDILEDPDRYVRKHIEGRFNSYDVRLNID